MKQGLFGWMNKHLRGRKGQEGFTLIELLVVVTILGILAAIVTLSLVGLTTNASVQSCNQEYKTVQAALDAYMAYKNTDTLAVGAADTDDMTAGNGSVALYNANPTPANPNFTRNGTTRFYYTWDTHGRISAIFSTGGGGAAPNGCVVT